MNEQSTGKPANNDGKYKEVYLPSNLQIEQFLQEHQPTFNYQIDKFRRILSLVYEIRANNKDIRKRSSYTPIDAYSLSNNGVRDYKNYLKYLLDNGILVSDNTYIPTKKCTGYKFTELYQTPVKVEQITKPTLVKAIDRAKMKFESNKYQRGMAEKYDYLKRYFNDNLNIDLTAAKKYLSEQLEEDKAKRQKNADERYNSGIVCANKLANHEYHFIVDSTGNRLHTNITNMPSGLRQFVDYAGMPLVSADIRCSQPCLSGVLLKPANWSSDSSGANNIYSTVFSTLSQPIPTYNSSTTTSTLMFAVLDSVVSSSDDIQNYLTLTQSGELYDVVHQQVLNQYDITKGDMPLPLVKKQIIKGIYSNNREGWVSRMIAYMVFRYMFPSVNKVFDKLKETNHAVLAIMLQKLEAIVVLDHAAKRISTELPDIPLYTIHDSIVIPVGYEDYVATVIREEMNKAIGILPTVKFDYWKPS